MGRKDDENEKKIKERRKKKREGGHISFILDFLLSAVWDNGCVFVRVRAEKVKN